MRTRSATLIAILLCPGTLQAAPATKPAPPTTVPTQFAPLQQSMQQLIESGYQVVNLAVG